MLSVIAFPPFQCYIDCQGTLDCFKGGAIVATAASNARAHLWGRFFSAFDGEEAEAHRTKAHATMADVEANRTTLFEKNGNDAADSFAKLGAGLHPSADLAVEVVQACALVVREAVKWAVEQEIWLQAQGFCDSQSILDPPLSSGLGQSAEGAAHDTWPDAGDLCEGAFRGHQVMAFHKSIASDRPTLGCLRCGAYAAVRAGRLRSRCLGARTPQHRRQRNALLAERHPAYPHEALYSIRRPTSEELAWLDRTRTVAKPAKPSASTPKPARSDVLRRFGLADEADLHVWRQRARRSAESVVGLPEDRSASEEEGDW